METFFVKLVREPSVQLCYSFLPSLNTSPRGSLIVFLNGINIPHTAWYAVATTLKKENPTCPPMLLYDRVGQAASIGHNLDVPGRPKGHGRDCLNAAHDLREVITHVGETRLGISRREIDNLDIILVASSVSCAIARLYATEYPRTVTVLLLLDSTLANSDTVSVFPDPESAEFSPVNLPPGVTRELCVDTRKKIFPIYGSESPNPEGLWRGNLPDLLPYAELPKLEGPKPGLPYVTVVAHDPEIFPSQVKKVCQHLESCIQILTIVLRQLVLPKL
jgi:pimeloyl-ACP methyl ester carboxylesterase